MRHNGRKLKSHVVFGILLLCATICSTSIMAQSPALTYYLPDIQYDATITTPEQYLGHQIGDWHISHDQLIGYMTLLAAQSDRIDIEETGRTHENRKLLILHISTSENLKNKEQIRQSHLQLSDTKLSKSMDVSKMPVVVYQGYSIHGNEPSGGNASALVAYYLAAGQSEEVLTTLKEAYILLDPCYNPDGFQRFSTWANSHKGHTLISDPQSREYNEMWPGGRTNHYWFDLNRDWLLLTHPESQSRIKTFHAWLPNILTDHHEMGTNSTFFFQPGVPSRVNPNTPWINQELTEEIGTYHAKALDAIGSQYYTKANFDDFYYGKGSTYPDIHGGIGILFEQASSRGHYQESDNGILTFPFTIRNQITTSLSTQRAAIGMKGKILDFQRQFYKTKLSERNANPIKGYVVTDNDKGKLIRFADILTQHQIDCQVLTSPLQVNNSTYPANNTLVVSLDQRQYGLIKTLFEKVTTFQDSIFYDVSAWTMPLAFDFKFEDISASDLAKVKAQPLSVWRSQIKGKLITADNPYAWAFEWVEHDAPLLLNMLQNAGLLTRATSEQLQLQYKNGTLNLSPGSVIIPVQGNSMSVQDIRALIQKWVPLHTVDVYEITSGYSPDGNSTGNPDIFTVVAPKVFTLVGDGVSSYDVGELWHHMDIVLGIPITMLDTRDLGNADLNKYNTLILAAGSYKGLSASNGEKIAQWIRNGGKAIAFENGINYLSGLKLLTLEEKKKDETKSVHVLRQKYATNENQRGSEVLGGAIFNGKIDITNPLSFGYTDDEVPIFKSTNKFYLPTKNSYATPMVYGGRTVLHSGYVPRGLTDTAEGAAAVTVHKNGGNIICFQDNPLFRGYWWGMHRMFANALYYGQQIDSSTTEKVD